MRALVFFMYPHISSCDFRKGIEMCLTGNQGSARYLICPMSAKGDILYKVKDVICNCSSVSSIHQGNKHG